MSNNTSSNTSLVQQWLDKLRKAIAQAPQDREELVSVLKEAYQDNLLDTEALAMIEGVLQVSELQVRDIMIPRSQMKVVDEDSTIQEMLPLIIESAHSRFPVVGDSRDEVIGILLAKDLLRYFVEGQDDEFNIVDVIRPAVIVPESKRLNILLNEFRNSRNHMAVIVDEYGGVSGLVTIEDVLEQIVGDITDEHDVEEDQYITQHLRRGYSIVKALTPVEDFNEVFDEPLDDRESDTVGGAVVRKFGRMPERGEKVNCGTYSFEVLRADSRRVHLLKVKSTSANSRKVITNKS